MEKPFVSPKRISVKEVDNGWVIEYWDGDLVDHTLVCTDQYEVMYYMHKLLCPPTPKVVINEALHRGPFR